MLSTRATGGRSHRALNVTPALMFPRGEGESVRGTIRVTPRVFFYGWGISSRNLSCLFLLRIVVCLPIRSIYPACIITFTRFFVIVGALLAALVVSAADLGSRPPLPPPPPLFCCNGCYLVSSSDRRMTLPMFSSKKALDKFMNTAIEFGYIGYTRA